MKRISMCVLLAGVAFAAPLSAQAPTAVDTPTGGAVVPNILPVPPRPFHGVIGTTFADSRPDYATPVRAPANAPNVLLILTDDVGFGASSTFGGPVPTPTLDRLANRGLRFNRFHTTAMCSPTRASLLTGRNHHAVGTGVVTDLAGGYPGYWAIIPPSAATVAEVLRLNGYNTAFFGKHHNVPQGREDPTAGPFDLWPTGLGFEYFYGFIGGDTNQWHPTLYRGTNSVEPPHEHNATLDHFLTEDAIHWVHNQKAASPDKPFMVYLAPGSAHAPHQAPPEWIARFKGQFDQGWDRLREQSFARQKALGVVPVESVLTSRPQGIPAWDTLTPDERKVDSRMMEVFAAMLAYEDEQIGHIINELDRMQQLDNTLVIFVEGDNGASPEGDTTGSMNELGTLVNGMKQDTGWLLKTLDQMGGPESYQVYPVGWAWATNAPFQWTKQVASHLGGTRNGLVISWPAKIRDFGGIRSQFSHVNDIAPTIVEAAGLKMPTVVNGVPQQRVDGVSLVYAFDAPRAPERHTQQYFEMLGNRAIYSNGWMASTTPGRLPWKLGGSGGLPTDYKWELYDLDHDFSQGHDLAASEPVRLAALQSLWMQEAQRNNVLPLDDRQGMARALSARPPGSPVPAASPAPAHYVYWGTGISIAQSKAPPIAFRSFTIDADITVPARGASGVLLASGSRFGGWSFHFENGRPIAYQAVSQRPEDHYRVASPQPAAPGKHHIRYDYDLAGKPGQGGTIRISIDDKEVARGSIGRTYFVAAGLGETFDIGQDSGSTVVDLPGGSVFNGNIARLDITIH